MELTTLKSFVEQRKEEYYKGKNPFSYDYWNDEGFPYAVMDYESSVPYADWTKADKRYCRKQGWKLSEIKQLFKNDQQL